MGDKETKPLCLAFSNQGERSCVRLKGSTCVIALDKSPPRSSCIMACVITDGWDRWGRNAAQRRTRERLSGNRERLHL